MGEDKAFAVYGDILIHGEAFEKLHKIHAVGFGEGDKFAESGFSSAGEPIYQVEPFIFCKLAHVIFYKVAEIDIGKVFVVAEQRDNIITSHDVVINLHRLFAPVADVT